MLDQRLFPGLAEACDGVQGLERMRLARLAR